MGNDKSYRPSSTTTLVTIRLPNDVFEILQRRAMYCPEGISGYARRRLMYDLTRKHTKTSPTPPK